MLQKKNVMLDHNKEKLCGSSENKKNNQQIKNTSNVNGFCNDEEPANEYQCQNAQSNPIEYKESARNEYKKESEQIPEAGKETKPENTSIRYFNDSTIDYTPKKEKEKNDQVNFGEEKNVQVNFGEKEAKKKTEVKNNSFPTSKPNTKKKRRPLSARHIIFMKNHINKNNTFLSRNIRKAKSKANKKIKSISKMLLKENPINFQEELFISNFREEYLKSDTISQNNIELPANDNSSEPPDIGLNLAGRVYEQENMQNFDELKNQLENFRCYYYEYPEEEYPNSMTRNPIELPSITDLEPNELDSCLDGLDSCLDGLDLSLDESDYFLDESDSSLDEMDSSLGLMCETDIKTTDCSESILSSEENLMNFQEELGFGEECSNQITQNYILLPISQDEMTSNLEMNTKIIPSMS